MRISDWSSDVCSSDLPPKAAGPPRDRTRPGRTTDRRWSGCALCASPSPAIYPEASMLNVSAANSNLMRNTLSLPFPSHDSPLIQSHPGKRSEEHTSELQSLMRISYAVFCLTKNNTHTHAK